MRIQDNRERDRERGLSEKTLEQSLDSWYRSNIEYSIILNTILNLQLGQLHYISLSQMFVQRILSENYIHPFLWKLLNFTFHCNVELLINLSCQKIYTKEIDEQSVFQWNGGEINWIQCIQTKNNRKTGNFSYREPIPFDWTLTSASNDVEEDR